MDKKLPRVEGAEEAEEARRDLEDTEDLLDGDEDGFEPSSALFMGFLY